MDHPQLQPAIALCFLYCGIIMGVCYSLFDCIHRFSRNNILQNLIDFFCAAVLCTMYAYTLFITTGGAFRFYPFLMTGVGFWLERISLHALILSIRLKRFHKSASHSV